MYSYYKREGWLIEDVKSNAPINATHYCLSGYGTYVHYFKLTKKETWVSLAYGKKFGLATSHVMSIGKPLPLKED
jgi:hypothetical protein